MSDKKSPKLDTSLCVNCGVCVVSCPVSCIELTNIFGDIKKAYPEVDKSKCISCSLCVKDCAYDALVMM